MIITRHAVSVSAYDGAPDLAHAAAWALIRTAQNEHAERITLFDTDDTAATADNLLAVACDAGLLASRSWPCATALPTSPAWPAPQHSPHQRARGSWAPAAKVT